MRPHRGQRAGLPGSRLGHHGHQDERGRERAQQQPPGQPGGCRAVLGQHAGEQCADGQARDGRDARHQRREAPAGPQVQQHGAEGVRRRADGYPLQGPGGEQQPGPVRDQEQHERHHVRGYGRHDQRPTPYVVGQGAEDQQRRQQEQHVDGEHRGQRGRRKSPFGLVDAVQRGRRGGRIDEQDHHRHRHPERRRLGQRMPGRPRLAEPAGAMTEPGHSGGRRLLRGHASARLPCGRQGDAAARLLRPGQAGSRRRRRRRARSSARSG
jgi:hypothetical protein